jgi:HAD superfamily hydrolase (TIGR01509 family)
MDGLIFDTETLYLEAFLAAGKAAGRADLDQSNALATVGLPLPATLDMLQAHLGSRGAAEGFLQVWGQEYSALAEHRLALKPGVSELLDLLDMREIPRAIATSTGRSVAESHLSGHDLLHRFSAVITIDECKQGKPHPEPYLNAASALAVAPSACWALEDSPNGIRSAHAAGMTAIMVPDLVQPDRDIRAICTHVLDSLHDVRALLAPES